MGSRGSREADAVATDTVIDVDALDSVLHLQQRLAVDDLLDLDRLLVSSEPCLDDVVLPSLRRISEGDTQQKSVELRLRERVRAFVLDRVGGSQDVKGRGQREGL